MKIYFIKEGENEYGPFTITQLKSKLLKKETLIWHAGCTKWKPVKDIYELKEIFEKKFSPISFTKNKLGKILGIRFLRQQFRKVS